jgi:hypothetical protein
MPLFPVRRQEDHAYPVLAWPWQLQANPTTGMLQKRVRDLQQDTSPVTRIVLTPARTAVIEILQHRQRLLHDFMRLLTLDVHDKADTTGIVLKARVVEALFGGIARYCHTP